MEKKRNQVVKKPAKATVSPSKLANTVAEKKPKSINTLLLKLFVLSLIVFGVLYYTDSKGWFLADQSNNHTKRKWDWYYHFTQHNEVDIVLVGNSRLYTGINPKNLSNALGVNSFILAAPGTFLTDSYYCLKEAFSVCKPKIAVIETHTISDYVSHEFNGSHLSDEFQSFNARKNFWQKLAATPVLFAPDNYPTAWSSSIRNHDFLFTNPELIKRNRETPPPPTNFDKLYLGRYVRFTTGMEDSTLQKVNLPETPKDDGKLFSVSNEARVYLRKIVDLCRENNVQLVFLSLPVYHTLTVDYEIKKAILEREFAPYNPVWLNLQSPQDTIAFAPDCFENIASRNQHMTYTGSLVATYKLAHFIHQNFADKLPNRRTQADWYTMFFGDEGFFENNTPPNEYVIARNFVLPNMPAIKELDIVPQQDYNMLYLKMEHNAQIDSVSNIVLTVLAKFNNQTPAVSTQLVFQADKRYDPIAHRLFTTALRKDIIIEKIVKVECSK
ncbi:MAG: hypothetical protein LBV31_01685 [Prevotellaceae bacterium]|jgi:hypothetical protein|nr:hypothetical protein [Prevotellaceae bacterium]